MRGDAAVTARLVLRGSGMAGLTAALGGLAVVVAALLPWHELVATVDMLGAASSRPVARVAPVPGWWWGWVCVATGSLSLWLAAGIALDRPVRWARPGLALAAIAMIVAAAAALLAPPGTAELGAADAALARSASGLPTGVELELAVRASVGPWMAFIAAALVVVGATGAREA